MRFSEKTEGWRYEGNSALKGWKPKTESDGTGVWENDCCGKLGRCGRRDQPESSIEDTTKYIPKAAGAAEFESAGGGNKLVKKTKERLGS